MPLNCCLLSSKDNPNAFIYIFVFALWSKSRLESNIKSQFLRQEFPKKATGDTKNVYHT